MKGNAKDKNIEDSKLEFITKAYFTLVPETQINQRSFRDIQFVAKLPNSTKQIFEDGAALSALPSYYVNNSVILQSNPNCSGQNQNTFCVNCAAALVDPMAAPNAGLFYPNCQLPSSIEFVRWWCVNGGGKFRLELDLSIVLPISDTGFPLTKFLIVSLISITIRQLILMIIPVNSG